MTSDGLSELIEKLERGEATQEDIARVEQQSRELVHKAKIDSAIESLAAIIDEKKEKVTSTDDPEEILNLAEHIGNYAVGSNYAKTRTIDHLSKKESYTVREEIKELIYAYCDTHLNVPRTNITTKGLFENIPKLRKLTGDSEQSLAGFIKQIRKEPDSRIRYERTTKAYEISLAVNYDNVAHAAERVFKSKLYVTTVEIAQELIVEKKHYRSIGRHLARWAKERNLDNEEVSMGKKIGQCVAYFRKDERPPITPTELVQNAVKDSEEVTLEHIKGKTGLDRRAISTIMTRQNYTRLGTEEGITYTKQTKG